MNLRVRPAGVIMSAAMALVLAAASPVSAAGPGTVYFVGQTTQLTPVAVVGGSGSYTFNSLACSGWIAAGPAAGSCSLVTSGTYTNIVCGTGTADGIATVSGFILGTGSDTFSYNITFVAGFGLVTGQAVGFVYILATGSGLPDLSQCITQITAFGVLFPTG